jgi:hypothetical protein
LQGALARLSSSSWPSRRRLVRRRLSGGQHRRRLPPYQPHHERVSIPNYRRAQP